jgi:hypothetical protein
MRRMNEIFEPLKRIERRQAALIGIIAAAVIAGVVAAGMMLNGPRRPPSIFDSPADNLAGYLVSADFNRLSTEERLAFLSGLIERFRGMSQSESAVVAAFFAGLTGPARERLRDNVRHLAKDILVEGADGYLALKTDAERARFLDQWVVKWARFADGLGGPANARSDEEILSRLRRQAERDTRGFQFDAQAAQQLIDFWQSDVAGVTSPAEQGRLFRFLPDLRNHMLKPR